MEINTQPRITNLQLVNIDGNNVTNQNNQSINPVTRLPPITLRIIKNDNQEQNNTTPEIKPKSDRIKRYTLPIFIERARKVHGDKYNYDNIKSKITIVCNTCSYKWTTSIHIINGCNCPKCMKQADWTYDRFLEEATAIHGNKYDYSRVKPEDVRTSKSKIAIICNTCHYEWAPCIKDHINMRSNCPNCSGKAPWTYQRFLIEAQEKHGNKYDYSKVTRDHVETAQSRIPVTCNSCHYSWTPSINCHLVSVTGCPLCAKNLTWTLERFLVRAKEIHGNKYNYENITHYHIENAESKLPITCNSCKHEWLTTIHNHVGKIQSGCPPCSRAGYSKLQINWIENIMKSENINIRHALSVGGEYYIPGIGNVDGFCSETNTVYEFHGDFWHGNPDKFPADKEHPLMYKTYGELYNKTLLRDQKIRDLGYNLVVKWETDLVQ